VHHDHIGEHLGDETHRGDAIRGLPDDLEVGLRIDDGGEPGAHEVLVVADHHADRRRVLTHAGTRACTVKPSATGPACNSPPTSATRSSRPRRPRPLPCGEPAAPAPFVVTVTSTPVSS